MEIKLKDEKFSKYLDHDNTFSFYSKNESHFISLNWY